MPTCECGKPLRLSRSSFTQYQPSVWKCECGKEYSEEWVRGGKQALKNLAKEGQ